ncbi:MAG: alpha/beta fold hydrolase [Gammaproteobacteria bacterium]|nr:alpha/beta fold hydrolase [Gammaproteobacteria bacterium]
MDLRIGPLLMVLLALSLAACNTQNIKPIAGGERIGVVLMHGKGGTTRWVAPLASDLRSAGVQVLTPDMPWHRDRIYDRTFDDAMSEIHGHVATLKQRGVSKVFVAGHSLGAVAAAGYAARFDDIQGIILLAPGHFVSQPGLVKRFATAVSEADTLIAAGRGDEKAAFPDIVPNGSMNRTVSANIYRSWFAADGPADFVSNMRALNDGIAVLYVAGARDRIPGTKDRSYAFDRTPSNPHSQFEIVDAEHLEVPAKATATVVQWLSAY